MIYLVIPVVLFFILGGLVFVGRMSGSGHRSDDGNPEPARRGCLLALASLLLRPVPVIFAYYYTGFLSAVFVALVIWLILRCFEIYSGKIWKIADLRLLILPLAAGLTLFTGDFLYFQLLPSAWCVMTAAEQSAGLLLKKPHLFSGENGDTAFSKDELKLARFGILGASLIALLISEYFRQTLSLSSWIWYYGYLRLELLPIMLGSITPAMVRMIRRSEKEAG